MSIKYDVALAAAIEEKCWRFAADSAKTQREHRSGGTKQRSYSEIMWDTYRGKMGEEIARSFLAQEPFKKNVDLDYDIYPRGVWDKCDIMLGSKRISVKTIKHFSQWLLLETKDLCRDDVYDVYILSALGRDRGDGRYNGGRILGYATSQMILDGPDVMHLKKGEYLPGTSTMLDADNHGLKSCYLKNHEEDWTSLLNP